MTQYVPVAAGPDQDHRAPLVSHLLLAVIATGAYMLPSLYAISMAETRFSLANDPSWLQQVTATLTVHIPAAVLLIMWWRSRGRPWPARAVLLVAGWFIAVLAVAALSVS